MDICKQIQISIVNSDQLNTIKKLTFSKTQWKFFLVEKNEFFSNFGWEKLCNEQLTGMDSCFNLYLNIMSNIPHNWDYNLIWIETFTYIKLITGEYVRATNDWYNLPWFSNIAIYMDESEHNKYLTDEGYCYGRILLLAKIHLPFLSNPLALALIQWYDFANITQPYLYECPLLKGLQEFMFIPIESIQEVVHIIPRFNYENQYFVNRFIW